MNARGGRLVIIKTGSTLPSLKAVRGDFEDWILAGMGISSREAVIVDVASGQPLPAPGETRSVVVTGSHDMVTDRLSWSEQTAQWLAQAVSSGAAVLGICYGHQLLAHALGGRVGYNPRGAETGTVEVQLHEPASRDALLSGFPSTLRVQASHSQSVLELPASAVRLASNSWDANQAFRVGGRAWGVQFHPEFDAKIMHAYSREDGQGLHGEIVETPVAAEILRRFATIAGAGSQG